MFVHFYIKCQGRRGFLLLLIVLLSYDCVWVNGSSHQIWTQLIKTRSFLFSKC